MNKEETKPQLPQQVLEWIKAILNEDADNLSIGSVRTLQMIKHEIERLHQLLQEATQIIKDKDDKIQKLYGKLEYAMKGFPENEKQLMNAQIELQILLMSDKDKEIAELKEKVAYATMFTNPWEDFTANE